jgi:hypothetical protein
MRHNHLCGGTPLREPETNVRTAGLVRLSRRQVRRWRRDQRRAPRPPSREQPGCVLFPLASAELDRWRDGTDDLQFTSVEVDGSPA